MVFIIIIIKTKKGDQGCSRKGVNRIDAGGELGHTDNWLPPKRSHII